jgi:hypothetical protein
MADDTGDVPRADHHASEERDMKIMLRAAIAAVSLASIGSAYADSVGGTYPITFFTQLPGVTAKAPVQNAPAIGTAQNGQVAPAYVTQSNRGTWLFPPNQTGDGTSG